MSDKNPFWKHKPLSQMNREEWESLCDGCAKCCLFKLESDKTGEVKYTNVACKLLDLNTCRCHDYTRRYQKVPGCAVLTYDKVDQFHWLPSTCAYRLVYEKKDLPPWHHLICGDKQQIHRLGMSVKGKIVAEKFVPHHLLYRHIAEWVNDD